MVFALNITGKRRNNVALLWRVIVFCGVLWNRAYAKVEDEPGRSFFFILKKYCVMCLLDYLIKAAWGIVILAPKKYSSRDVDKKLIGFQEGAMKCIRIGRIG